MQVEVVRGDIAHMEADALVNAANNHLWMGGGIAGALKRAGGWEIEVEAQNKGPIPIGEAVATGAGRLKARYVIHAALMGQDLLTNAAYIKTATRNSLKLANELGIKSLVFPAFGTGVGRFPVDESARIMIREIKLFGQSPSSLEKILFVLFHDETYQIFLEELERQG